MPAAGRLPAGSTVKLTLEAPQGGWVELRVMTGIGGSDLRLHHGPAQVVALDIEDGNRPEILVHHCPSGGPHHLEIQSTDLQPATSYTVAMRLLPQPDEAARLREEAQRLGLAAQTALLAERPDLFRISRDLKKVAHLWNRLNQVTRVAQTHETMAHAWIRARVPAEAAFSFRQAIAARQLAGDLRWLASNRNFYGLALRDLQDVEGARREFEAARDLAAQAEFPAGQAGALNNLAILAEDAGDFGEARSLYRQAIRLLAPLSSASAAQERTLYRENLARLLMIEGDLDEAAALLVPAARNEELLRPSTMAEIAWIHLLQDRPEAALEVIDQALSRATEPAIRLVLSDRRGTALERLGRPAEAVQVYLGLLALEPAPAARAAILASLCRLAALHPDQAQDTGPNACRQAVAAARIRGVAPGTRASAFYWHARLLRSQDRLIPALGAAEAAAEIIGLQRRGASSPERRSRFLEERADYLQLAMEIGIELHRRRPQQGFDRRALVASELWRARTLIDQIREGRDDDPHFQLLQQVRRRLHLSSQIRDRRPEPTRAGLNAEIERLEAEAARLETALRQRHLRSANALQPGNFRLETLQAQLDGATQVFDLVLGRTRSCLWRITRESVETYLLPPRAELEKQAGLYLELLAEPHQSSRRAALLDKGAALAVTLFGRDLSRIRDQPRLLFIGDGALAPFPLAALPLPGSSPDDPTFLIERLEIVQLPSLQMLGALRLPRPAGRQPTKVLAAIGDPWYDAAAHEHQIELEAVSRAEAERELGGSSALRLARLPFARTELDLLTAHLEPWPAGTLVARGPAANRELVLGGELRPYTIVHISAHATLDPEHPEHSELLLSEIDRDGPKPGGLRPNDLFDLGWNAELVVASACQTAQGKSFRFEGIGGLARGFFHAGANRALASLWKVEGGSTARLMDKFYGALLGQRQPAGAALRTAQLALLAEARRYGSPWRAPYYWSGFVLIGDWQGFSLP